MATCAVEGQAVGTAAAQSVASGILPRALARDLKQVQQLQQTLLRDDQTIKGRANQDPSDLARSASVSASAEDGAAKARLVIDGIVRNIPDENGDPIELHQWAAPVEEAKPAWIELAWESPQRLRRVQITFDSGFKRQLTLSAQEIQNVNLVRAPQPETVKNYSLTARTADGETHLLASVKDNFERVHRHAFEPVNARSLRLEIDATNGDRLARVFEIRCYA
jgi:hypothetical protein